MEHIAPRTKRCLAHVYPCGTALVPDHGDGRVYEMATELRDGQRVAVGASAPGASGDMGEPTLQEIYVPARFDTGGQEQR